MVNMLQPNMPALAPTKDKGDFIIHQDGPINAEPAKEQLAESWRTPASLSYMRNHGDVLHLAREGYELVIDVEEGLRSALQTGASFANKTSLGLKQILETGRQELDASLQCAGNRRNELNERAEVEGIQWSAGTVLNAKWSGEHAYCQHPALSRLTSWLLQVFFSATFSYGLVCLTTARPARNSRMHMSILCHINRASKQTDTKLRYFSRMPCEFATA